MTNTTKQDELKLLISEENISMCAAIETQLAKKFVNKVGDYVFKNWSWVSNTVDSNRGCRIMVGWDRNVVGANLISQSDQVMHCEINFINDHRKQFVSFVYAKNSKKDRKPLWKNLANHCLVVNNEPWVVLGDFNVTLNVDESSNSFGVIDKDMDVFRKVLFDLCLDDIISYRMFYTWTQKRMNPSSGILRKLDWVLGNPSFLTSYDSCFAKFLPYMTSDHYPALIVYPDIKSTKPKSFRFMNFLADKPEFLTTVKNNWGIEVNGFRMFVLTKRLKNMKRYMRNLNRVNGNVFDKVKVLRVELKRMQTSVDKELDNIHLMEEEYVYCKAYKEAIIFKSRIEEVYDAQGNKYVGDTIASKFVEHFQKFLGFEDEVFPIEDLDGLFIKKLDSQCADSMVRPILDDEIKHAMFSIEDDKAAEFFASSKLLGEFNANLISLVPKLKTPLKITDYRPIACGNVVYKCISKVIVNRLKEGLGSIIDCNQSAFILGRQISDNILLAQEFVNGYSCKGGALKCAFKVDIEKAYDTVSWEFLKTALIKFGFHASMIKWIMVCLTTASFSICINGAVHGFFKGKRGLRQGDPMSPRIKLTHLCFADDLLMLCHGDLISASILRRALDEFSMSSGLYPNMSKITTFYGNVPESIKGEIHLVMPFRVLVEKNFVWSKDESGKGIASVALKDVCRPKEQGKDSLWVKWLNVYRIKGNCIWDLKVKKNFSWNLKQILSLRDNIRRNVGYKIGNGRGCFIWYDRWHSNGPLCRVISNDMVKSSGFDLKAKVADFVGDNGWKWPSR
ncbi:RNA-directed DNA polymerase, eukaryota, reverse transcriptase zinc-binding domain protein [Tanacetum coccineum]